MQVQHSQDIDTFVADQEIHAIGKVPKQRAMHRRFLPGKLPGILDDAMEHVIKFVEELPSQTARWSSYHTAAAWISSSD
jgi:hypothetical protein